MKPRQTSPSGFDAPTRFVFLAVRMLVAWGMVDCVGLQAAPPWDPLQDMREYLLTNPAVSNATLGTFDQETQDYFWIFTGSLAARGRIDIDAPATTPPDDATNGTASVSLSPTETARIQAAKTAQALWLDRHGLVPWRLRDFEAAHLHCLFDRDKIFNQQSVSNFYFFSVVDYSPSDAYGYARNHDLIRDSVNATINAVLDDLRSDFLHGNRSFGDPTCAYRLETALTNYSSFRFRPARISRSGCHSMSRILVGLLRSLNIPAYETTSGAYFLNLHSEAVLPSVQRVLPHGDHVYSGSLTATPSDELTPTIQFFIDNASTPPTGGEPYRIALRHEAIQGTRYPSPTMLRGVSNPVAYGYTSATGFLSGYAGWDRGLTPEELEQAADTLLTQFTQTHRLTFPNQTPKGYILNSPSSQDYATNSRVSLKALPKPGYTFDRWTGDVSPNLARANPLVFFIDTDKSIEALFLPLPANLQIARLPQGLLQIRFLARAPFSYRLEHRADLHSGFWQFLTNYPAPSADTEIVYQEPAMGGQRFYRALTRD